jgi:hypothetical protein
VVEAAWLLVRVREVPALSKTQCPHLGGLEPVFGFDKTLKRRCRVREESQEGRMTIVGEGILASRDITYPARQRGQPSGGS